MYAVGFTNSSFTTQNVSQVAGVDALAEIAIPLIIAGISNPLQNRVSLALTDGWTGISSLAARIYSLIPSPYFVGAEKIVLKSIKLEELERSELFRTSAEYAAEEGDLAAAMSDVQKIPLESFQVEPLWNIFRRQISVLDFSLIDEGLKIVDKMSNDTPAKSELKQYLMTIIALKSGMEEFDHF